MPKPLAIQKRDVTDLSCYHEVVQQDKLYYASLKSSCVSLPGPLDFVFLYDFIFKYYLEHKCIDKHLEYNSTENNKNLHENQ